MAAGISGEFEKLDCRNPKRTARFGRRRYAHSSNAAHGTTIQVHCNEWLGFERVKSVQPYAVEPVYDIEVDGPHNFVAEGLVGTTPRSSITRSARTSRPKA